MAWVALPALILVAGALLAQTSTIRGLTDRGGTVAATYALEIETAGNASGYIEVSELLAFATDLDSSGSLVATNVESDLEALLDLQDLQGAVTDAQVPNTITVDLATLATTATTANSGDSATSFFSSGEIADARVSNALTLDLGSGSVTGGTVSRCARFDGSGDLVAATGDCPSGDTGGGSGSDVEVNNGGNISNPDFTTSADIAFSDSSGTVSATYVAGAIVNADVNASAAIELSKLEDVCGALQVLRRNAGDTDYECATAATTLDHGLSLLSPTTADDGLAQISAGSDAITISRITCWTLGTGSPTATINIEERAPTTPGSAGTDVLSSDLVCDGNSQDACASGCDVNTITNGDIDARDPLALMISATGGTTVTSLAVSIEYGLQ